MSDLTPAVTSANFTEEVLESSKPVLVDFWAEWCGPCRKVGPVLEEIAGESDAVRIVKLNVDENPDISREYKIMSIPAMVLFKDGKPADTLVGAYPKSTIKKFLGVK